MRIYICRSKINVEAKMQKEMKTIQMQKMAEHIENYDIKICIQNFRYNYLLFAIVFWY